MYHREKDQSVPQMKDQSVHSRRKEQMGPQNHRWVPCALEWGLRPKGASSSLFQCKGGYKLSTRPRDQGMPSLPACRAQGQEQAGPWGWCSPHHRVAGFAVHIDAANKPGGEGVTFRQQVWASGPQVAPN